EPMFQEKTRNFAGKEKILGAMHEGGLPTYEIGLCPLAERVQKQILAFKTNYWDWSRAEKQAEILRKTIKYFS
ncbi:MAG: hypothetical protein AAB947_01320, partial [Patescibacteria group bacterium]